MQSIVFEYVLDSQGQPLRRLNSGDIVRHFKGNIYRIIGIAKHSEMKEDMVVYERLYGIERMMFVRPAKMFMSEVDKAKYPNSDQKYRFERIQIVDMTE